ncbi:hypothetical protein CEK28_08540 [Xenophilus sp. AP218F]|nr:hypothetical protein CEK28_08540 [Xenophilus sp. AP218F]
MTRKTDVWMPLYIADYLADTARLTTEQHGAYLLLIMDYWRNGSLPDDDSALANVCRLSTAQWKRHRPTLSRLFQVGDGVWRHKRVDAELSVATDNAARRQQKARDAANKRWRKGKQAGSNAHSSDGALPDDCPSPSPSPTKAQPSSSNDDLGADAPLPPLPEPSDAAKRTAAVCRLLRSWGVACSMPQLKTKYPGLLAQSDDDLFLVVEELKERHPEGFGAGLVARRVNDLEQAKRKGRHGEDSKTGTGGSRAARAFAELTRASGGRVIDV